MMLPHKGLFEESNRRRSNFAMSQQEENYLNKVSGSHNYSNGMNPQNHAALNDSGSSGIRPNSKLPARRFQNQHQVPAAGDSALTGNNNSLLQNETSSSSNVFLKGVPLGNIEAQLKL